MNDHDNCLKDDEAFCFSFNLRKVYNKVKSFKDSVYINKFEIITFLADIFKIRDGFSHAENICDDWQRKSLFFDNQSSENEITGGRKKFQVKELEVYEIKENK